jgi:hypothetical protein
MPALWSWTLALAIPDAEVPGLWWSWTLALRCGRWTLALLSWMRVLALPDAGLRWC